MIRDLDEVRSILGVFDPLCEYAARLSRPSGCEKTADHLKLLWALIAAQQELIKRGIRVLESLDRSTLTPDEARDAAQLLATLDRLKTASEDDRDDGALLEEA
ncbi:MAG TPA: hypothetical protein VFF73_41030 [Planctomycetota bacterium]|nr:hypothetical protein [Planctomycetota bacterium]